MMPKKSNPSRKSKTSKTSTVTNAVSSSSNSTNNNEKGEFSISIEDQIKYNKEYQESLSNLIIDPDDRPDNEVIRESSLWVDVYSPKTLDEYISDNSDVKAALDWFESFQKKKADASRYLLITGRPGIGKTTLAHLIFKKYGYDYQEYNASEVRSGSELKENLAVFGRASIISFLEGCGNTKKGLIMDEIDGIDSQGKESDGLSTFLDITQASTHYPIICIANDESSTKVSRIRTKSFEIKMKEPSKISLMTFLQKIVKGEKIQIDKKILTMIIEDSSHDFRQVANKLYTLTLGTSKNEKITMDIYQNIREFCKNDKTFDLIESIDTIMNPETSLNEMIRVYESDVNGISATIFSSYLLNLDTLKVNSKEKFKALGELSKGVLEGEIYCNYYWKHKHNTLNAYQGVSQVGTAQHIFSELAQKDNTKLKWKNTSKRIFYLNPHMMNRLLKVGLSLGIYTQSYISQSLEVVWNLLKSSKFIEKDTVYKKMLETLFNNGITPDDFDNFFKGFYLAGQAIQDNEKIFKKIKPNIDKHFMHYLEDRSKEFQGNPQLNRD
jgi:DNA polymerase III delta prime subunit